MLLRVLDSNERDGRRKGGKVANDNFQGTNILNNDLVKD